MDRPLYWKHAALLAEAAEANGQADAMRAAQKRPQAT